MVRWATKPTCERVRHSFIVAYLKYRTNILKKILSSIFSSTKDSGSEDVLCTWKSCRLCLVVLILCHPLILPNSKLNSYCLGWLAVFGPMVNASICKCLNNYFLQKVDIYKGSLILPYGDLITNRIFPSSPQSIFQSESKCEIVVMVIRSNFKVNEN